MTNASTKAGGLYPFLICLVAAVGGFLFGYDLVIISGAQIFLREQFNLNDAQFGFATTSAILGCIAGPFLGAWMCDKFGRKRTLIFSSLLFGINAIGTALPNDIVTFNVFRIVGGVGVGLCSIASPMYIAEIAPARIRGGLGIMYQLAIAVGCLAAAIVAYFLARYLPAAVSWRWMFGSEMAPIIGFVAFLLMVPESPRWLAEKDRFEEARRILAKVEGDDFAEKEIAGIKASLHEETGGFKELLQPGMKWALLVGLLLALFNNLTGWSAMGYYLPTLFQKGGFPNTADAIFQFLIVNIFAVVLTLLSILLVDRFGRRPLWLFGSAAMAISLTLTGIAFQMNITGVPLLLLIFLCAAPHAVALGPLPWLMMSEIYPTRLRAKAVAVTTTVLWTAGFAGPYVFPIISGYSERTIGSGGGAFWVYAVICVLAFIFGLKILPETKGRTLEDIAASWKKR